MVKSWMVYYQWYGIAGGASFPIVVFADNKKSAYRKAKSIVKRLGFCTGCDLHGFSDPELIPKLWNPWMYSATDHRYTRFGPK